MASGAGWRGPGEAGMCAWLLHHFDEIAQLAFTRAGLLEVFVDRGFDFVHGKAAVGAHFKHAVVEECYFAIAYSASLLLFHRGII